jgi:hypothetical protein
MAHTADEKQEEEETEEAVETDQWGHPLCMGRRVGLTSAGELCATRGTIEHEGKLYCMKHHPEMVALTQQLKDRQVNTATGRTVPNLLRLRAAALYGAAAAFKSAGLPLHAEEFTQRALAMSETMNLTHLSAWIEREVSRWYDVLNGKDEEDATT